MSIDEEILRQARRLETALTAAGLWSIGIGRNRAEVRRALDRLTKRGELVVSTTDTGRKRWRLAPDERPMCPVCGDHYDGDECPHCEAAEGDIRLAWRKDIDGDLVAQCKDGVYRVWKGRGRGNTRWFWHGPGTDDCSVALRRQAKAACEAHHEKRTGPGAQEPAYGLGYMQGRGAS